jgi:branched-chain amino acid transport system permease protein
VFTSLGTRARKRSKVWNTDEQEIHKVREGLAMESDDRDIVYRQFFDKKQREYLRTLVCDEIIEEHQKSPRGQHTEPLERLLLYFRHAPQKDKYVVKRDERSRKFRIAQLSGKRDLPLRVVSDKEYATAEEVYHEIFLRRVRDLLESDT